MSDKPNEITIPVWYVTGGRGMIRRSCLPHDHEQSEYNYVKNTLGLIPEDYGVYKDESEYQELKATSIEALIKEIIELREVIRGYEKAGF